MDDFGSKLEKDVLFTLDRIRSYERNKAIDDFVESVKNLIADSSVIRFKDIDEIAEQLKVGGENDRERSN